MFTKILTANRGESGQQVASPKPPRLVHAAHAGDFDRMEPTHV